MVLVPDLLVGDQLDPFDVELALDEVFEEGEAGLEGEVAFAWDIKDLVGHGEFPPVVGVLRADDAHAVLEAAADGEELAVEHNVPGEALGKPVWGEKGVPLARNEFASRPDCPDPIELLRAVPPFDVYARIGLPFVCKKRVAREGREVEWLVCSCCCCCCCCCCCPDGAGGCDGSSIIPRHYIGTPFGGVILIFVTTELGLFRCSRSLRFGFFPDGY